MYAAEYNAPEGKKRVAVKLMRVKATNADKEEFLAESELLLLLDSPAVIKVNIEAFCTLNICSLLIALISLIYFSS